MRLPFALPAPLLALVLAVLANPAAAPAAHAGNATESGEIDPTFAEPVVSAGWRRVFGFDGTNDDFPVGFARRAGGGYLTVVHGNPGSLGRTLTLQAFTRDGDVDNDFGANSRIEHDQGLLEIKAMLVDSAGRILVAGTRLVPQRGEDVALVRYRPDGALDQTFGVGGVRVTGFDIGGVTNDIPFAIVEQPVVGAGSRYVVGVQVGQVAPEIGLIGITLGGELDTAFGNQSSVHPGRSRLDFIAGRDSVPRALARIDGDLLLVAGSTVNDSTDLDVAALLVSPLGLAYASDSGGAIVVPVDIEMPAGTFIDGADAIAIDAQQRAVIGGHAGTRQIAMRLLVDTLHADIALDPTFVGQGLPARANVFVGSTPDSVTRDVGVRPEDGTIFLVGQTNAGATSLGAVQRVYPDGLRGPPEAGIRLYIAPAGDGPSHATSFLRVLFDRARPVIFGRSPDSTTNLSDMDGILTRLQTTIDTSQVFADHFE